MLRIASVFLAVLVAACFAPFALAQPANNTCATATNVNEGSFPFTTVGATPDGVSATCRVGGPAIRNNVWFLYRATGSGVVTISTCGAGDTVLSVHINGCVTQSQVACDDNSCTTPTANSSRLTLSVITNSLYLIQIAQAGATPVSGTLVIAPPGPPNDTCASATNVNEGSFPFSTSFSQIDGPAAPCRFEGPVPTRDVFFRYIPTQTGPVTVSTCGGGDTTLTVFSGACGSLTPIACDDDSCNVPTENSSTLTFPAVTGTPYIIRVANWSPNPFSITLGTLVIAGNAPANDTCAAATPVGEGSFPFSTAFATIDGPPAPCRFEGPAPTKDVFFRYTPSQTGPVVVSTCGGGDTTLSVLAGACGALTPVACDDDTCGAPTPFSSRLTFSAVAGTPYTIRVANWSFDATIGLAGTLVIAGSVPANDLCVNATVVTEGSTPFTTAFAAANGPAASCRFEGPQITKDVFFRFTPPRPMTVRISTCGAFDTTVSVLSSCTGTQLACDDDSCGFPTQFSSSLDIRLVGGLPVIIRVANWNLDPTVALSGNLVIAVRCDSVDFNNDGVFPDDEDLSDFIRVLSGSFCGTCSDVDFNNDGVFPDDQDLADFLFVLSGGSC